MSASDVLESCAAVLATCLDIKLQACLLHQSLRPPVPALRVNKQSLVGPIPADVRKHTLMVSVYAYVTVQNSLTG